MSKETEIWDIYDINGQKTNATITRGEKLSENQFHVVVAVCVFNSSGQLLIQQRQKDKIGWPNRWDLSAAGSAIHSEYSRQAAQRELFEEIGIEYDFTNIRPLISVKFERGVTDYYCIEKNIELNNLSLQKEEVQAVKWTDKETIFKMIDDSEFIPYYKSLINCIFEMRNASGSHLKDGFNQL